jgi:hypothetical protein
MGRGIRRPFFPFAANAAWRFELPKKAGLKPHGHRRLNRQRGRAMAPAYFARHARAIFAHRFIASERNSRLDWQNKMTGQRPTSFRYVMRPDGYLFQ